MTTLTPELRDRTTDSPTRPRERRRRTLSPWRRVLTMAAFETRMLARQRTTLLTLLMGPALVFGIAMVQQTADPAAWSRLLGLGSLVVIVFSTHWGALFVAVARREQQVFKRLRTSELSSAQLVTAVFGPFVALGVLEVGLVTALFAGRGGVHPQDVLLWGAGVLLASAGLVAAGVAVAGVSASTEKANWTGVPLIFLVAGAANLLLIPMPDERIPALLLLVPFVSLVDLVARSTNSPTPLAELPVPLAPEITDLLLLAFWSGIAVWFAASRWKWEPRG
jgi:ABC-2 type transport system permease protein